MKDDIFNEVLKQISDFYLEKREHDSMLNFNYVIEINSDLITGVQLTAVANDHENSNVDIKNDLCNVTLTCEDKQNEAHKMSISSSSPIFDFELICDQIYNNLCEEFLREVCDEKFE